MPGRTVIPFGPQHPVLPEPIHLDLVMEDEKVVQAVPRIGFIHRGFEKLARTVDFNRLVYVADRICGICAFIHSLCYCQGVEALLGVQVPPRAVYLRTIWSEIARLSSHLLWLGLMADAFGFENMFMQSFRLRERVLDILEETTGGRIITGVCKIGGVRRDVEDGTLRQIVDRLGKLEILMREVGEVFLADDSVRHRLAGVGVLGRQEAHELGCVGPMMRASGIARDTRLLGYAAYGATELEPVVRTEGDSYARCAVRIGELFQSVELIRQLVPRVPAGEVAVKASGNPAGEYHSRCEQPRGEVIHYLKADGTRYLQRYRVRTPTFANLPALVRILQGCSLADVPVLILSIDPCISCMER
jgi:ech hydrogenase subunit E